MLVALAADDRKNICLSVTDVNKCVHDAVMLRKMESSPRGGTEGGAGWCLREPNNDILGTTESASLVVAHRNEPDPVCCLLSVFSLSTVKYRPV